MRDRPQPEANAFPLSTFTLFLSPFHLFREFFEVGQHLITPSTRHIPPECVDAKIKHRSRLHWWLAEQEVRLSAAHAQPLALDLHGNVSETNGSNFLLVKNGEVYSPLPRNILLGISRRTVIELCAKLAIPFLERDLQIHDAMTADEAFVTTTPYCMAPVTRINGVQIGDGAVGGPTYHHLLKAWSEEVGLDIRAQILGLRASGYGLRRPLSQSPLLPCSLSPGNKGEGEGSCGEGSS